MYQLSNISVSEGTVTEPVTLSEVKDWLKVDYADDDALLTSMITGARQTIEQYCNISLVPKTVTLDMEVLNREERVPMPYTNSLASLVVNELATDETETLLVSGTDFFVRGNNIRITEGTYTISYTTVPTVPEAIKEAIKMEIAERYSERGENGGDLSKEALDKVQPYRIIWL